MNLGLETDVNNKNFMGAVTNPDDMLAVEFLYMEPIDIFASQEKGVKTLRKKEVYIRKAKPGDGLSVIERIADENDKKQFPIQWMRFQMQEGLTEIDPNLPGWKINEWPELNEDQVRFLTFQRFQTVEQLAGASDSQIQGIGMGGVAIREKARVALRAKMDSGFRNELNERDMKIAGLEKQVTDILTAIGNQQGLNVQAKVEREVIGVPKK